ncbi:gem-associated protein 8 [Rhipicephalus sanguineus]|uniref:gem-associated protein 8 n=1 Tax=Rhipicephalus sanguineus TaxID=34632 RepID=UPI0018948040|nr:gem-associated protein 8 [Rhipicephalus sanguineus]
MRSRATLNNVSCAHRRWYQNPLFKRYWHHYQHTINWFQDHQQLLRDLTAQSAAMHMSQTGPDGDFEMPVTEELIAFFEHSARHRKSLGNSGGAQEYQWQQAATPASYRRQLHYLYGPAAAASVRGMETAVQLSFEHFTDSQQPKPWPNIPLKL